MPFQKNHYKKHRLFFFFSYSSLCFLWPLHEGTGQTWEAQAGKGGDSDSSPCWCHGSDIQKCCQRWEGLPTRNLLAPAVFSVLPLPLSDYATGHIFGSAFL